MIRRIEACNYRCLRNVSQTLEPFSVLVGPNGSGKSTLLDVVSFLGDLVSDDLDTAMRNRTQNFLDLVWGREGEGFELKVIVELPKSYIEDSNLSGGALIAYHVKIRQDDLVQGPRISDEIVMFHTWSDQSSNVIDEKSFRRVVFRDSSTETSVNFRTERPDIDLRGPAEIGHEFTPELFIDPTQSAFRNLPEDTKRFPSSVWLKRLLKNGIVPVQFESSKLRAASPPGKSQNLLPDGSNLGWVVHEFERKNKDLFDEWIDHLQTALPDVAGIRTVIREDDKHCYLMVRYPGGLEIPSWMLSDGTLRLIALTLIAYLPDPERVYLIEEPENGIHPLAIESVAHAFSSAYDSQILVATHSPILLARIDARNLFVFSKNDSGETSIRRGSEHPMLEHWKGEIDLGTLYASGVLGE